MPTSLALLDLREALEEDLVILQRAGATIVVPTRGVETEEAALDKCG